MGIYSSKSLGNGGFRGGRYSSGFNFAPRGNYTQALGQQSTSKGDSHNQRPHTRWGFQVVCNAYGRYHNGFCWKILIFIIVRKTIMGVTTPIWFIRMLAHWGLVTVLASILSNNRPMVFIDKAFKQGSL